MAGDTSMPTGPKRGAKRALDTERSKVDPVATWLVLTIAQMFNISTHRIH
jgi:hypothetical protein